MIYPFFGGSSEGQGMYRNGVFLGIQSPMCWVDQLPPFSDNIADCIGWFFVFGLPAGLAQ